MRVRVPSAGLGLVLLAAIAARGAESGVPLESSKQELRKLDSGQKTGASPSATEGLRPSLPAIQSPGQDALPSFPVMDQEKLEKERKRQKDERKNWLVNGVEQLERKDKEKTADAFVPEENKTDAASSRSPDGSDPQYLLKLYDEQKKLEQSHKPEAKPQQRAPQADPLAPFLQGWLGNSPARGQFFDEFVRKPEGATAAAGPTGPATVPSSRDFGQAPGLTVNRSNDLPAKPNPYLTELERPVQSEREPVAGALSLKNPLSPPVATPLFSKPLIPLAEPPPEARPPERKAPPAPLADDRKYFPQLKKF